MNLYIYANKLNEFIEQVIFWLRKRIGWNSEVPTFFLFLNIKLTKCSFFIIIIIPKFSTTNSLCHIQNYHLSKRNHRVAIEKPNYQLGQQMLILMHNNSLNYNYNFYLLKWLPSFLNTCIFCYTHYVYKHIFNANTHDSMFWPLILQLVRLFYDLKIIMLHSLAW